MRRLLSFLLCLLGCCTSRENWGRYSGIVCTEWLDNGRDMRLLDTLIYTDQNGIEWIAPQNSIVNGASIPKPFWSIIGGPFEGKYRNASVIHDVYCGLKQAEWQSVHRMFYSAMRCSGVDELTAKIMFAAVWKYGPRWKDGRVAYSLRAAPTASDVRDLQQHIEEEDLTLEQIEELFK